MKKSNLFLVILMALIVMSCSKDETTMSIPQESNAIEFGTYVGRDAQTRASVQDISTVATTGFGVFAYYTNTTSFDAATHTTPNFMNNQEVAGDNTAGEGETPVYTWTYEPVKYWPNNPGDKVSFFAYAPYNLGGTTAPSFSGSTLEFTVVNTVIDQIDLLWNSTSAIDLEKQTVGAKVPFNFRHALSRIGINVKAVVDEVTAGTSAKALAEGTTITVNKIVLCKSVVINYGTTESVLTGAFYETGELDLNKYDTDLAEPGTAKWDAEDGAQSFTLTADNFKEQEESPTNTLVFTHENSTVFQPNNANSYVMIIPQDFETNAFTVYIEYEVETKDTTATTGEANSSTITNKIATPVAINFESGKAYALNLQLGMTSVKLEATVTGWDVQDGTVVDVPINTAP